MRKMKKMTALLLTLALAMSCAACSSGEGSAEPQEPEQKADAGQTDIVWAGWGGEEQADV